MALTISSMLPLGTELPKFSLPNTVDGSEFSTTSLKEMPTLIMFICNHCPYVIHYHSLIQQLETDFNNVFNLVAISSNDVSKHPDDAPSKMTVLWKDLGFRSLIYSMKLNKLLANFKRSVPQNFTFLILIIY